MNSNAKSILGFSNSEVLYETQKDSNAIKPLDSLLIKPTSEFMTQTSPPPPPPPINVHIRQEEMKLKILPKTPGARGIGLGIEIGMGIEVVGGGGEMIIMGNDDDDGGCTTPTSIHHKIPLIQQCPFAPKKPKSIPCRKRRSSSSSTNIRFVRRRIDFYDCLSPLVQTHLEDLGCRIKKIRATPPTSPYKNI